MNIKQASRIVLLGLAISSVALGATRHHKTEYYSPPSKATQLFLAAVNHQNFEMADLYLSQSADINCHTCHLPYGQNFDGLTPLMQTSMVTSYRAEPTVQLHYLIEKGANINLHDKNGKTTLMYSIKQGVNPAMSQDQADTLYLLDHGADVKATDVDGNNALHYLADEARDFSTASMWASKYNAIMATVAQQMIAKGATINQQNRKGETPIYFAASRCDADTVSLFYSLGADPSLKTRLGETPLSIAMEKAANSGSASGCNQTVNFLRHPTVMKMPAAVSGPAGTTIPAQNGSLLNATGQMLNSTGQLLNSLKSILR